jgi:ATP-dependent RNA circularization protein (DNA/RNA ligase family)
MKKPIKPLKRKNYGSIPHLSNSKLGIGDHYIETGQERILTEKVRDKHDEVFVFEKYDGSNVGIGKINNKIVALTRSGYIAKTSPYRQHHLFNDWVYKNVARWMDLLEDGERITGEWLVQAHGLKYSIEVEPIIFFDHFNAENQRSQFDYLGELAVMYGLQLPRMLHRGQAIKTDDLLPDLNLKTNGIWAKENPEGMVYRVERKSKVDFLAKWVRSDFEAGKYIVDKEDEDLTWNIDKHNP